MINPFTIDEVRDFWDSVADIYEPSNDKVGYVHYQRYERALQLAKLEDGHTVLNIWSRMGSLVPYIRQEAQVTLFNREVSPKFIEQAQSKFPEEEFRPTDLEDLSEFPNNHFDRIISLEVLEHTPKPLVFLQELHRILKPGGLLVTSLPPRGFEIPTMIWDRVAGNHGEGPHLFLWPSQVKSLFKEANFMLLTHDPTIILPLGSDKRERWSEKILKPVFSKTFLANIIGVRHFYVGQKE